MKKFTISLLLIFFSFILIPNEVFAITQKRWKNPNNLKTYIQPGYGRSELIKKAFRAWSAATKDKVIFYYVDTPEKAQIEVSFGEKIKGTNNPGTAGLTRSKYLKDEMIHAEILIPVKTSSGIELPQEIVYISMLHEIGHALGILNHSTNPQNLMYPTTNSIDKTITKYDLAELYRIYGWQKDF